MAAWKTLDTRIAYKNKWLQIREDSVIAPAGHESIYGVVELTNDAVYIAPFNEDGTFNLVQQFRYAVQRTTWEFPAGQSDGEDPEIAARRELLEETGFSCESLNKIGKIALDTGSFSSMVHVFVAQKLKHVTHLLDQQDGIMETKSFLPSQIQKMIMNGEIISPHTIATFYMATEYLKEN